MARQRGQRSTFAELPLRLITGRQRPDYERIKRLEIELGWEKEPLKYMPAGHVHGGGIQFGCACVPGTAEVHRKLYAGTGHDCVACDYMARHPECRSQYGPVAGLWSEP